MAEQATTGNLSAVVPVEVADQVENLAEQERRTTSFMTRILIEEALAARAKKAKKQ